MPGTVEALAVVLVAILPGALYVWAFERQVGRWGVGLSDRLLRFVGASAVLHALAAPATYTVWRDSIRPEAQPGLNEIGLEIWVVVVAYVAIPAALGLVVGAGYVGGKKWARFVAGSTAPPTAWDAIFSSRPAGYVLMRLRSGRWIGGEYAKGSFAGGYPEPADIFLSVELAVDQAAENFVLDNAGKPQESGYGVLVKWEDVEYLEVGPTEATTNG